MARKGILQDIVVAGRQHEGLLERYEEGGEVVEKVDHQHTGREAEVQGQTYLKVLDQTLNKLFRKKYNTKQTDRHLSNIPDSDNYKDQGDCKGGWQQCRDQQTFIRGRNDWIF